MPKVGNRPSASAAAGSALVRSRTSGSARAAIAPERGSGEASVAALAPASAAVPVMLLPQTTAERVRTIVLEGTSPATLRAHAGDVAYFWAWAAAELALPERYPAPAAAVVQ